MRKGLKFQLGKHAVYTFLLILLYVIQTTPRLFAIGDTKPVLVVVAALGIALFEGEYVGAFYGAFGGILCDMAAFTLFGYNGFMLALACIIFGLLIEYLMRPTLFTFFAYTFVVMLSIYSISFVFIYGIWRLPSLGNLYLENVVGMSVYTTLLAPLFYYSLGFIHNRFSKALAPYAKE